MATKQTQAIQARLKVNPLYHIPSGAREIVLCLSCAGEKRPKGSGKVALYRITNYGDTFAQCSKCGYSPKSTGYRPRAAPVVDQALPPAPAAPAAPVIHDDSALPKGIAFRLYGSPSYRAPFKTWLQGGLYSGFMSGASLDLPGADSTYGADKLIEAARDAGWIVDCGYKPSFSQAAFAGLEARRTVKGVPAYSYPREHGWSVAPEKRAEVETFCR